MVSHLETEDKKTLLKVRWFSFVNYFFCFSLKNVSGPLIKSNRTHLLDRANLLRYSDFCNFIIFSGSVECVNDTTVHACLIFFVEFDQ